MSIWRLAIASLRHFWRTNFALLLGIAIGTAVSNCYEAPKPDEFGVRGQNWDDIGWKVDVVYKEMTSPIRPLSPTCTTSKRRTFFNPVAATTGPAIRTTFPAGLSNSLIALPCFMSLYRSPLFTLERDMKPNRAPQHPGNSTPP